MDEGKDSIINPNSNMDHDGPGEEDDGVVNLKSISGDTNVSASRSCENSISNDSKVSDSLINPLTPSEVATYRNGVQGHGEEWNWCLDSEII